MNTVERKFDREVLWESIATKETLYKRDSIRTDAQSEAKLTFKKDGSTLDISENSLIILDQTDEKIAIEFLKGSLFAKGAAGRSGQIEIQTAQGSVRMSGDQGGDALALRSGKTGLEIIVKQGRAILETKQGSVSIDENERGHADEKGVNKKQISVKLIQPVANAKLITEARGPQTAKVTFKWNNKSPNAKNLINTLQVSRDLEFTSLIAERIADKREDLMLPPGSYYWRVMTMRQNELDESDIEAFQVFTQPIVKLVTPDPNEKIHYVKSAPLTELEWRTLGQASGGDEVVELSHSEDFSELISPTQIKGPSRQSDGALRSSAVFEHLEPGEYYWRVSTHYRGVGADGDSERFISTVPRSFTIEKFDELAMPKLDSPAKGKTIGTVGDRNTIRFTWSPVEEAFGYLLKVSTDPEHSNIILEKHTRASEWEGSIKATGKLYWSVQAMAEHEPGDQDSKLSPSREFTLVPSGGFKLLAPEMGYENKYLADKPQIQFRWQSFSGTENYEVQISQDSEFSRIEHTHKTDDPTMETNELPTGACFWRVKALDPDGKMLALSETGRYVLRQIPPPPPVIKTVPEAMAEIVGDPPPPITFQWKSGEQAQSYRITIWKQKASGRLEVEREIEAEDPKSAIELDPGTYLWDVRAIDSVNRLGEEGQARQFAIRLKDRLPAPSISAPEHGAEFEEITPKPISLRWKPVKGADSYILRIEKITLEEKVVPILSQEVKGTEFKTPGTLKTGEYIWRVAAKGILPGVKDLSPREGEGTESQFSVKWIGILRAPAGFKVKIEEDKPNVKEEGK